MTEQLNRLLAEFPQYEGAYRDSVNLYIGERKDLETNASPASSKFVEVEFQINTNPNIVYEIDGEERYTDSSEIDADVGSDESGKLKTSEIWHLEWLSSEPMKSGGGRAFFEQVLIPVVLMNLRPGHEIKLFIEPQTPRVRPFFRRMHQSTGDTVGVIPEIIDPIPGISFDWEMEDSPFNSGEKGFMWTFSMESEQG